MSTSQCLSDAEVRRLAHQKDNVVYRTDYDRPGEYEWKDIPFARRCVGEIVQHRRRFPQSTTCDILNRVQCAASLQRQFPFVFTFITSKPLTKKMTQCVYEMLRAAENTHATNKSGQDKRAQGIAMRAAMNT